MPVNLDAGLSLHPFAAVLIDQECKVIGCNHRATIILRREKALFRISNSQLRLGDSEADARLRSFAARAATEDLPVTLRVQSADGCAPLWLVVRPLELCNDRNLFLVSIRLRDDATIVNTERVMTSLGLTMAEAELTVALANGSSIRQFAEKTHRTVPTLRWHLSNILRKTECNDQADLARTVLLMSL